MGPRPSTTTQTVLTQFKQACEESRAVAHCLELDHVTTHHATRRPLTLRWVYLRMVEELSRHAGHADLLREQIEAARPESATTH